MLEVAFDDLNRKYFESALSKSVITIQSTPSAYGHFTTSQVWDLAIEKAYEINIGAETLNRKIEEIIATLIHEMVHQYCAEKNIKDTSRGNTYHNKRFKEEAEKRGLVISYAPGIGWSVTEPTKELIDYVENNEIYKRISMKRNSMLKIKGSKKSSTRKYVCLSCNQTVRATKEVNILCGNCKQVMVNV
ncbi:SprT-like family protein [Erwinia sp. CPCC 100877]|nr:SprT-like family protein [Erwinia sp. CPCC 100877]